MREFKFKVYNADKKSLSRSTYGIQCFVTDINAVPDPDLEGAFSFQPPDNLSFLCCTGFKARNYQEIYEGDILLDHVYSHATDEYVVFWHKETGMWMLGRKDEATCLRYLTDDKWKIPMYQYFHEGDTNKYLEVVGNIHTEKSDEQI